MTGDSRSAALPSWSQLKAIADGQRMVLWALLIGTLAALATVGAGAAGGAPDLVSYLFLAVVIGVRGWMALSVYRLSKALGSKVAILWAIGGFLPNLIGLVVLAVLSGRATGRLKKAGLRVGLLGARLPSEPPPGFACQETVGQFA